MLQLEILVRELGSIDGLPTSAWSCEQCANKSDPEVLTVTIGKVATLNHELLDDSVERRTLISETLLTGTELPEVLGSLRDCFPIKANDNAT